jgi:hypothetical protein
MGLTLKPDQVDGVAQRLAAIQPDSQRQWGKLTAHGMMLHLRVTIEMSLEEREAPDISNAILRSWPVRMLLVHVLPIPKAKITAPDSLTPPPELDFDSERTLLVETLRRFAQVSEAQPHRRTRHLAFGRLTMRQWQILHGKHVDFHLRQFGV